MSFRDNIFNLFVIHTSPLDRNNMNDSYKKHLKIAFVLVGIIFAMVTGRYAFNYIYHTLPPKQVSISVRYSPEISCRMDTPVYMLIKNRSMREIANTSFTLSVKKKINSDNFIQLLKRNYSTDKSIKAGDSYGGCWTYPKLITNHYVPEELIYEISGEQLVFRG